MNITRIVVAVAKLTGVRKRHQCWKARRQDKAWGSYPPAVPSDGYIDAILDAEYEAHVDMEIRAAIAVTRRGYGR